MRAVIVMLLALTAACSLVVSDRTKAYEGACAGEEEAIRARYNAQGNPSESLAARTVEGIGRDCQGCGVEDCVEDCIQTNTNDAVSFECASCYADAADCAFVYCRVPCTADNLAPCQSCICEHGCGQALNDCAGQVIANCP